MNHNHIRKSITLLSNYNSKIPLSTSTSRVFKGVLIPHLLSHRPSGRFLSTFKTSRGNDAGWILISHCYTVCRTAAAASYAVKTSSFSCKYVVSTLNYSLWQKLASKMGIVKNCSSLDLTSNGLLFSTERIKTRFISKHRGFNYLLYIWKNLTKVKLWLLQ